jgi:hypothetical protein
MYASNNSSTGSDFDGSQPLKLSSNPTAVAFRRLRLKKRTQDDEHVPPNQDAKVHVGFQIEGARIMVGASNMAAQAFPLAQSSN